VESAITSKGPGDDPEGRSGSSATEPGDRVKFFIHPDGSVVILPKLPASALRGIVKARRRRVSIDEMNEAIAAGAAESEMRRKPR
jgi:hypothetical protein